MMINARRKVLVRTVNDTLHAGYMPVTVALKTLAGGALAVELLEVTGRAVEIPLAAIQHVAWVRDFNLQDRTAPENLVRRVFAGRPRVEGLWVRVGYGGQVLEGIAASDLSLVEGLVEARGIYLAPPDTRSNTQRLFIPRGVMESFQVLGVITTPSKTKLKGEPQAELFPAKGPEAREI